MLYEEEQDVDYYGDYTYDDAANLENEILDDEYSKNFEVFEEETDMRIRQKYQQKGGETTGASELSELDHELRLLLQNVSDNELDDDDVLRVALKSPDKKKKKTSDEK